jgi:aminoglycoside phosphotransferase (APT) family kinase protein
MTETPDPLSAPLAALIRRILPGATGIAGLRRLSGGAVNETWAFMAEGPDGAVPLILRRAPGGTRTARDTALTLETEARLIALADAAGIPVPPIRHVLAPADGLGAGFIMAFVPGETIPRKILRDAEFAAARSGLARQCGAVLARLHCVDPADFPELRQAPAAAELALYRDLYRSYGQLRPVFELALRWLGDHLPARQPELALVHGDFRNGNLMVGPEGLRAVLDWELAHLGDPMEDLGWISVNSWRFGQIDKPVGGFGTREDLFAGYEEAGGGAVDPGRVTFWEILGTLKWGIMCMGMAAAFQSGADPSIERGAIGRRASETEIDLLRLLAPRDAVTTSKRSGS